MKNEKTRRQPGLSLNKFRVWIVLVGGIILGCAMTLSYNHTVDLFKYAGYVVWLSHIGTVMIELTFFLGTSVIILSRAVGMAAGWPARATFIFGAALVLWSNVSSGIMLLDEQWTAVVLGIAVVMCLFLMEAVVSRALFMFRADTPAETVQENVQTVQSDVRTVHKDVHAVQENEQTVQKPDTVVAETTEDRLEIDGNDSVHVQDVQTDVQSVYETADTPAAKLYNYHKKNGKLPGRVRVAQMCGMDVKDARRLLDRMNREEVEREAPEEVA